jgi:hypothetical protein
MTMINLILINDGARYHAAALFGWMFTYTWFDISKHWFTVLFASSTLWLCFEREYTHRGLDEIRERMKALQRDMVILKL